MKKNIHSVDLVIPVFNEGECVPALFDRLNALKNQNPSFDWSFIFINDGSSDHTGPMLDELAGKNPYVKVIHFSRNFGHQRAVTAGVDYSTADAVVIIDADLQDPPELIIPMLDQIGKGYDVVYGKRRSRKGDSWFKKVTAKFFYRLLSKLCNVAIPEDTGDFRIITRPVADALKGMREDHRFIRGMVPWLGFNSFAFEYDRDLRLAGVTKYPFKKMFLFALDAIFSFSIIPLRMATHLGLGIMVMGSLGSLFILYLKLFTPYTVPGISSVILLILILGGIQILMLGVMGEYIGRNYEASKRRPLYVVRSSQNFKKHEN